MAASERKSMTDEELISLVATCKDWADRPVTTTTELAEQLDVTRQAVHSRLTQLHEKGEVKRYKPGQAVVWWRD